MDACAAKESEEKAAKHTDRLGRIRQKAADLSSTIHRKMGPDPNTMLLTAGEEV